MSGPKASEAAAAASESRLCRDTQLELRKSLSVALQLGDGEEAAPAAPFEETAAPPSEWPAAVGECLTSENLGSSLWALQRCSSSGRLYVGGRAALTQTEERWGEEVETAPSLSAPFLAHQPTPRATPPAGRTALHSGHDGSYAVVLEEGGGVLHAGSGDGAVRSYELPSGRLLSTRAAPAEDEGEPRAGVYSLVRSASGLLLAGDGGGAVHAWGAGESAVRFSWPEAHGGAVTALALQEPEAGGAGLQLRAFSGGEDGAVCCVLLSPDPGAAEGAAARPAWRAPAAHAAAVTALALYSRRSLLFSAAWDGSVQCRHAASGALRPDFQPPPPAAGVGATSLALCPRGEALYVGFSDGSLAALALPGGGSILHLGPDRVGGRGALAGLALCPDGESLYAACVGRRLLRLRVALPARWAARWEGLAAGASSGAHSHARFPPEFRAALRTLAMGAYDRGCALGAALGPLDAATRTGLLFNVAAQLAEAAYGVPSA